MAERGTNFYYPPDFDPKIHGSANGYQGVHHLRERARKIDEGIIIIRFEMPYNIWCEGCKNHIGMGVRYNAQKTKVGKYYSTTIYKFRMKCHLCDNYFEIQTDPKNLDYEILSGATRQERRWDTKDNEQVTPLDSEESIKKASNAMYKLEHEASDRRKLEEKLPILERIQRINSRMEEDYDWNCKLRKSFRTQKKLMKEHEAKDTQLLEKCGLAIKLLPEHEKDIKIASLMKLSHTEHESREAKRKEIMSQSVFSTSNESILIPSKRRKRIEEDIVKEDLLDKINEEGAKNHPVRLRQQLPPLPVTLSPKVPLPSFLSLCRKEEGSECHSSSTNNLLCETKSHTALEAIRVYHEENSDDDDLDLSNPFGVK